MRVEVKFPGKTEAYYVDDRGTRKDNPSTNLWLEAYLCAVIRALLYSDDHNYKLSGWRKIDPLPDIESESRLLEAVEKLFSKGWQLGSEPEVQVATTVTNHLTTSLLMYFAYTGRHESAINLFEKLRTTTPEATALLVRTFLNMDEEIRAIDTLTQALLNNPLDHVLLDIQCQYLQEKGRNDLALKVAKRAVNCAPAEFLSWARLTEIYIAMDEYEQALLTLNSCPMFTYYDKDTVRLPVARTASLPMPQDTPDEMAEDPPVQADSTLLRLPAPSLRGTFSKAYDLLSKLVTKVGWDDLLRYRSQVFVMEEEYRTQKATPKINGTPTMDKAAEATDPVSIQEPKTVHAPESSDGEKPKSQGSPFQDKRLCERWLDNLFMVLYEDLRVFTIWRAEMSHFKTQNLTYRKTSTEWEILGDLAWRLYHQTEAEEAYQAAVEQAFSVKSWRKLLEIYQDRGDFENALTCVVKVTSYNRRWYGLFSPALSLSMRRIIDEEGLVKVQNIIAAKALPKPSLDLMERYFTFAREYQIEGSRQADN